MDPVTLMLLGSAAIGGAQAIGGALPSKWDRANNKRLKELEGERGLTDAQRARMGAEQMAAVRAGQAGADSTFRRNLAATGTTSGEVMQAARRANAEQLASAGMETKKYLDAASSKLQMERTNEREQRLAAKSERGAEKRAEVTRGLGQIASAAGQFAALPPEARAMGVFGAPKIDPMLALQNMPANMPAADKAVVENLVRSASPEDLGKIIAATSRGMTDSQYYRPELRLVLENNSRLGLLNQLGVDPGSAAPALTPPPVPAQNYARPAGVYGPAGSRPEMY